MDNNHPFLQPQNTRDKAATRMTIDINSTNFSTSNDNVPNSNQQQQPPPPLPHPQQGHAFAQSPLPFWMPQVVAPAVHGGGSSSTTQTIGYTYSCYPVAWNQSAHLAQMHQLQHPYVPNFVGTPGFSSETPNIPGESSLQIETIKKHENLSPKHKKLWEEQLMKNFQLRNTVSKLQDEVSNYNYRLTKIEEELSSLKLKAEKSTNETVRKEVFPLEHRAERSVDEAVRIEFLSLKHQAEKPTNETVETIPVRTEQPRKRGRPRKLSIPSTDAPHESQSRAIGKSPAPSKPQFKSKEPIFEKVILKERTFPSTACGGQVNQGSHGGPSLGPYVNFEPSKPDKGLSMGVPDQCNLQFYAQHLRNSGKIYGTPSPYPTRPVLSLVNKNVFYKRSFIPNVANEEGASKEHEDASVRSAEDENEEEVRDDEDTCSAA